MDHIVFKSIDLDHIMSSNDTRKYNIKNRKTEFLKEEYIENYTIRDPKSSKESKKRYNQ